MSSNNNGAEASPCPGTRALTDGCRVRGQRGRRCQNRDVKPREAKFKGKCKDLKGFVYEVSSSRADSFARVNREVAEYVARTIPDAGEFRMAMINMDLEDLDEPIFPPPDAPNLAEVLKIWREERKTYVRRRESRCKVMNQVFPIVLGQCDPAMCDRMEADEQWEHINNACNVIRMLCLIWNCEVQ